MALYIEKHARRVLKCEDAKLVAGKSAEAPDAPAIESGFGWLEGYAAVFGNVDLGGEIVAKGTFLRSIEQAVPAGKCKLMVKHYADGGDTLECIGTITQAREDDYGLWIHAEFANTKTAQDTRGLVSGGHVKGLSVGFMPLAWSLRPPESDAERELLGRIGAREVLTHTEAKLCEVTVTARPMNELAGVTASKSLPVNSPLITGNSAPGQTSAPPLDSARMKQEIAARTRRLNLLSLGM